MKRLKAIINIAIAGCLLPVCGIFGIYMYQFGKESSSELGLILAYIQLLLGVISIICFIAIVIYAVINPDEFC